MCRWTLQVDPPMDPSSDLTILHEIFHVDDDVWDTSLPHDVDPRRGLTAEQIAEGKITDIKRLSQECNVFVPRLRSEVPHLERISARWEIQARSSGPEKKARCRFARRGVRRGDPRIHWFAVASSSITTRLIAMKRQKVGEVIFTFDITCTCQSWNLALWTLRCLLGTAQGALWEAHCTEGLDDVVR